MPYAVGAVVAFALAIILEFIKSVPERYVLIAVLFGALFVACALAFGNWTWPWRRTP